MEDRRKIGLQVENRVAHIILDNPPDNRMDMIFFRQLHEAVKSIKGRDDIGAAVIYGSKRHFSAGAELDDIKRSLLEPLKAGMDKKGEVEKQSWKNINIFMEIEASDFPVIAAVGGFCAGSGMELAMSCDMIFCSRDAIFSQPEITWGLITGCSGSVRLKSLITAPKARELLLRGNMINAGEAYEAGIANRLVERGRVVDAAVGLAERLAEKSRYQMNLRIKKEVLQMYSNRCRGNGIHCSRGVANGND